MSVTPEASQAPVCAVIDWASIDHAICIIDPEGGVVERFFVVHDASGLKTLVRRLLKAGVDEVGIEGNDGPVVESLLQAELTVLVIAPSTQQSGRVKAA